MKDQSCSLLGLSSHYISNEKEYVVRDNYTVYKIWVKRNDKVGFYPKFLSNFIFYLYLFNIVKNFFFNEFVFFFIIFKNV